MKHLLCLITLGIFLLMAVGSGFLDESTNVSVKLKPSDCAGRPPFTGKLQVTVINPPPIGGFPSIVELFLSNQKINDTIECLSFYQHSITHNLALFTGSSEIIESPTFTHDNKGDLWRVQIRSKFSGTDDWEYGEVKVLFYDQTQVSFTLGSLPQL